MNTLTGGYRLFGEPDIFVMRFLRFSILLVTALLLHPRVSEASGAAADPGYRESVYVHTDRDLYVAGEHILFSTRLLKGQDTGKSSGFIYLLLRGAHGNVSGVTLPLDNAGAHGSIYIPDTLSTGYYELFAFTNWMRNFGEQDYFRKPLLIVNRFDENPLIDLAENTVAREGRIFISPEGGMLAPGVENRLLVRSSRGAGDGFRDLWIIGNNNDTLSSSRFNGNGFAVVELIPGSETEYSAVIAEGETVSLPAGFQESELAMMADEIGGNISLRLQSVAGEERDFTVRVSHSGITAYEQTVQGGGDIASLEIEGDELPEGLLLIEAGHQGRGYSLRRYWYNCGYNASPISVGKSDEVYGTRDRAVIVLDGSRLEGDNTRISVSVVETGSLGENQLRFDSYMRARQMKERGELVPGMEAEIISALDTESLNNYLIDAEVLQPDKVRETEFSPSYYLETGELIITGRVKDPFSGEGVPDTRVMLNSPDTLVNIKYTRTDQNGGFHFVLPGFYHDRELYLYAGDDNLDATELEIEVFEKFGIDAPFRAGAFTGLAPLADHIRNSQNAVRVNKAYGIEHVVDTPAGETAVKRPPLLYSSPNHSYYTENYVFLDSLPEIAREIIHPWRFRYRDGSYESVLFSAEDRSRFNQPPVYFLDGIITGDIGSLAGLNSAGIYKIEVHNLPWVHGEIFFPGIIAVFTTGGQYREILSDRTVSDMIRETLKQPSVYEPPEYGDPDTGGIILPDLRQLLFWNACITLESGSHKEIEFYSGDLKGEFAVIVQGITNRGVPFYHRENIYID